MGCEMPTDAKQAEAKPAPSFQVFWKTSMKYGVINRSWLRFVEVAGMVAVMFRPLEYRAAGADLRILTIRSDVEQEYVLLLVLCVEISEIAVRRFILVILRFVARLRPSASSYAIRKSALRSHSLRHSI